MNNEGAEGDEVVVSALQSHLFECPNFASSKQGFDWKKYYASETEFSQFLKRWPSLFASDQKSIWLSGMSVRGEDRKSDSDGYIMDFDSGDEDADFEEDKSKKPLKRSTDDEGTVYKATTRRASQSAKYVPPKINVKMPPPAKTGQVPGPTKQEEDKKKPYRPPQQGHQQSHQHHQQQQQQQQQQYHQPQGQNQKKIPDVTPPSYMHNLDKQPMTNREKFMCYKVQRLEAKLEKTSTQLQKFRTGYQNLVNQLTCPICMEPSAKMYENHCCSSLCCERCALLRKECPACHKSTQWIPSPVATKIASTLKAECPFGCGEECSYSDLERHKSEFCLSALVSCPHPLCSIKIRRRHLEKHLNEECAFKADNCDPARCGVCAARCGLPLPTPIQLPQTTPETKGKEEQRFSQESLPRAVPEAAQDRRPFNTAQSQNSELDAPMRAPRTAVKGERRAQGEPTLTDSQEMFDPTKYAASSPNLPDSCTMM